MNLTTEYLHECFKYDDETGKLYWRTRPLEHFNNAKGRNIFNAKFSGKEAGSVNKKRGVPHLIVVVSAKHYYAHRIIWKMVHGYWPPEQIDHINGDGIDNRLSNLREVSGAENSRNLPMQKSNTSGVVGVHWDNAPRKQKWCARIATEVNKRVHLGYFDSFEDAVKARKEAEVKYGYHTNHGRCGG